MNSAAAWRQIDLLRQEEGLEDLLDRFGIKLPTSQNTEENVSEVLDEVDFLVELHFPRLPP